MFEFIKVVSDTVFDRISAVYHDKPLMFIVYLSYLSGETCLPSSGTEYTFHKHFCDCQRCFWHCIRHDKWRLSRVAFDFYQRYLRAEVRLLSSGSQLYLSGLAIYVIGRLLNVNIERHSMKIKITDDYLRQFQAFGPEVWSRVSGSLLAFFLCIWLGVCWFYYLDSPSLAYMKPLFVP